MVGWFRCPTCGTQYISDPQDLTVWYSPDNYSQLVAITCPRCSCIIEDRIAITGNPTELGFPVRELNDRFTKLTEEEIISWDIDKELQNGLGIG